MQRKIRQANKDDVSFVFATMLRSLRYGSPATKAIDSQVFYDEHQRLLERLFIKKGVEVRICCNEDDPDHIFGYIVFEHPDTIHFIYVKKPFRGYDIAKVLLEGFGITRRKPYKVTHFTQRSLEYCRRIGWTYNPYLLR